MERKLPLFVLLILFCRCRGGGRRALVVVVAILESAILSLVESIIPLRSPIQVLVVEPMVVVEAAVLSVVVQLVESITPLLLILSILLFAVHRNCDCDFDRFWRYDVVLLLPPPPFFAIFDTMVDNNDIGLGGTDDGGGAGTCVFDLL